MIKRKDVYVINYIILCMFRRKRNEDDEENNRRGMRNVNQNAVYFECEVCGFRFQENPNQDFIECPQCGSEDVMRI